MKRMEERISETVPELKQIASGLSIKVLGMKGSISEGELLKCKKIWKRIATQLKSD
ncbi:MAG: hypothetical protein QXD95_08340 [Nitrososphaeria archaeon]